MEPAEKKAAYVVLDANGSVLTPALLAFGWCHIPPWDTRGVFAYLSPRQLDWLLSTSRVCLSAALTPESKISATEHRGSRVLYVCGVPIMQDDRAQDELVSYVDEYAGIHAQIKNLRRPPDEQIDNHRVSQ